MAWKWMFFFRKERNWDTSNPVAERSPKEIRIGILNQSLDKFSQGSKSTRLPGRYATQGQSHTQWGLPAIQCKMHPVHQLIWTNKDIVFDLFPNLHVCLSASSFYKIYIYMSFHPSPMHKSAITGMPTLRHLRHRKQQKLRSEWALWPWASAAYHTLKHPIFMLIGWWHASKKRCT